MGSSQWTLREQHLFVCRFRDQSVCRDFQRSFSFHQQRDKLDCGEYRLDEHYCLVSRCLWHEPLCWDFWRCFSFDRQRHKLDGGEYRLDGKYCQCSCFLRDVSLRGHSWRRRLSFHHNGRSWTPASTGLTNGNVQALAVSGTNLFAGTASGGVCLSADNGTGWAAVGTNFPYTPVIALAVSPVSGGTGGTNLFAGTQGSGVFLFSTTGTSWTAASTGLTNTTVWCLALSGTYLFAGTDGGVFLSTNSGTSWNSVNAGLTNTKINGLSIYGANLFVGTSYVGVWRRPLSEMVTSVEKPSTDLPAHFNLEQNYPNPFNPATTISFGVPFKSLVTLRVFDALGREASTLVAEELAAGTCSRQWNAANVSSGIYFYRLQAGAYVETKKMLVLK